MKSGTWGRETKPLGDLYHEQGSYKRQYRVFEDDYFREHFHDKISTVTFWDTQTVTVRDNSRSGRAFFYTVRTLLGTRSGCHRMLSDSKQFVIPYAINARTLRVLEQTC